MEHVDEIQPTNTEPHKVYCQNPPIPEREIPYFGGCPTCKKTDGSLNVGRGQYFVCREHRVYWFVVTNFSSWEGETEAEWERNSELLDTFQEVKPICDDRWNAPPGHPATNEGATP